MLLGKNDPNFPTREWDRILPQIETTLNLLHSARANPRLSAYAYLHGQFDYNKTPLVPMGTKIVSHLKPDARSTWAPSGEEGWTVGYSPEHYRHIKAFFPVTCSERNVDTVSFFPQEFFFLRP